MKARVPEGYGGGGAGNMNTMIRQAQKVQENMAAKQEELDEREFSATVGGGVVEVKMMGNKQLQSIKIDPAVIDPDDVDMLQDLVVAAVNEVYRQVQETADAEMAELTGGLNMPGVF